jgi:hypothetical protein
MARPKNRLNRGPVEGLRHGDQLDRAALASCKLAGLGDLGLDRSQSGW